MLQLLSLAGDITPWPCAAANKRLVNEGVSERQKKYIVYVCEKRVNVAMVVLGMGGGTAEGRGMGGGGAGNTCNTCVGILPETNSD